MIELTLNGESRAVRSEDVRSLLIELGLDAEGRGLAVAVDGHVVPRARWSETRIAAGQDVEIVTAAQGG